MWERRNPPDRKCRSQRRSLKSARGVVLAIFVCTAGVAGNTSATPDTEMTIEQSESPMTQEATGFAAATVTWTGVVRTSTGEPVSQVEVILSNRTGLVSSSITDEAGSFLLEAPSGPGYSLSVFTGPFSRTTTQALPLQQLSSNNITVARSTSQDLILPPFCRTEVTVRDSQANPVNDAFVSRSILSRNFDDLRLPVGYEFFRGAPISGIALEWFGYNLVDDEPITRTDGQGEIALWRFPSNANNLIIDHLGVQYFIRDNAPGTCPASLDVQLPEVASLAGTLRTADGQPVQGATVWAMANGTDNGALTAVDGTFEFSVPKGDGYTLLLLTREGRTTTMTLPSARFMVDELTVEQDENIDLSLPPMSKIDVTVQDGAGNPVTGAEVTQFLYYSPIQPPLGYSLLADHPTSGTRLGRFGYTIEGSGPVKTTDSDGTIPVWTFPGVVDGIQARFGSGQDQSVYGFGVDAITDTSVTIPQLNQSTLSTQEWALDCPTVVLISPFGTSIDDFRTSPVDVSAFPDQVTPSTHGYSFSITGLSPGAKAQVKLLVFEWPWANTLFKVVNGRPFDITSDITIRGVEIERVVEFATQDFISSDNLGGLTDDEKSSIGRARGTSLAGIAGADFEESSSQCPSPESGYEVTFSVTDGAFGDEDSLVNGVIIDPVVPAIRSSQPPLRWPSIDLDRYLTSELPDTK